MGRYLDVADAIVKRPEGVQERPKGAEHSVAAGVQPAKPAESKDAASLKPGKFSDLFPLDGPGWHLDLRTGRLVILGCYRDCDGHLWSQFVNECGNVGSRRIGEQWPDTTHGLSVDQLEGALAAARSLRAA